MYRLLPALLIFLLTACGSTNPNAKPQEQNNGRSIDNPTVDGRNLTDYLRTLTGVVVSGDGPNATIRIRGIQSVNLSTEPLFVIDGVPVSGGLASAYSAVNVADIARIEVLAKASETSIYGVRGANGVIVIQTKR